MDCIDRGKFQVRQPFTGKYRIIEVTPENTHSIVFWSKNYQPFISMNADKILVDMGFSLYFHFTVNSCNLMLEPNLPSLSDRLEQLTYLVKTHGPDKISWRFDPICFYEDGEGKLQNNLGDFSKIADYAGRLGIKRCVTSFYDSHAKVKKRQGFLQAQSQKMMGMVVPDMAKKAEIIRKMAAYIRPYGMTLGLCSEKKVFSLLCPDQDLFSQWGEENRPGNIIQNACIDARLLQSIYKGKPSFVRDRGQRMAAGCNCTHSIDIGSYQDHPCLHNCLFCYARTGLDLEISKAG